MNLSKNKDIISSLEKRVSLWVYPVSLFLCLSCGNLNESSETSGKLVFDYELPSDEIDSSAYEKRNVDILLSDSLFVVDSISYDNFQKIIDLVAKYIGNGSYDKSIELLLRGEGFLLDQENSLPKKEYLWEIYSYFGQCYIAMNKYDLATESYNKGYEIAFSISDIKRQLLNLNDLAVLYLDSGNKEKNLELLKKALMIINGEKNILKNLDIIPTIYLVYLNTSNHYVNQKQYALAEPYFLKAKELFEQNRNLFTEREEIILLSCEADFLLKDKKYAEVVDIYNQGLALSYEIKHPEYQVWFLKELKKLSYDMGDYKSAYLHQTKQYEIDSSLFNRESTDKIADLQTRYETEKLKSDNQRKDAQLVIEEERRSKATILAVSASILALLAIGAGVLLKRSNNLIKKQKAELALKNQELEEKNNIIIEKNAELGQAYEEVSATNDDLKEKNDLIEKQKLALEEQKSELEKALKSINDDIKYSANIQDRFLSNDSFVKDFPNPFVYRKPKKDVGGDFFISGDVADDKKLLIVGDCTGKSVPGSLLTIATSYVIQNSLKVAKEPSDIVTYLDDEFKKFNEHRKLKEKHLINDSLELACVFYDPKTRILDYSVSNQPFYVIRDGELLEFPLIDRSDRKKKNSYTATIGSDTRSEDFVGYKTDSEQLLPGDTVFLFSDGMKDQFSGTSGSTFKKPRFVKLLKDLVKLPSDQQMSFLEKTYSDWKTTEGGELVEQTDDMILIGFTVE